MYLSVVNQAMRIEWATAEEKTKNLGDVIRLTNAICDMGGLVFGSEKCMGALNGVMGEFEVFYREKKESMKVDTLLLVWKLLETFTLQRLKGLKYAERQTEIKRLTFLTGFNEQVVKFMTDYFDNVREQAQLVLKFMVQYFLNEEPAFTEEQLDLLQMLRANSTVGWSEQLKRQLKEMAEMEAAINKHIFEEPQTFLKNVVAIMMDETHGRDNLILVIKEFNKRTPFMVLNDYRIAVQTNSLRRVEILKELVFKL